MDSTVPIDVQKETAKKLLCDLKTSNDWSRSEDHNLLQIFQTMHQSVMESMNATLSNQIKLENDINNLSNSLTNVNNRFIQLCNTQFIENKVQEDELNEIPEVQPNSVQVVSGKNDDIDRERIVKAVRKSLFDLKELCDEIQLSSDSDSDDDDGKHVNQNVVLKPRDSYGDKYLPYIIGSQKWRHKSHLGLQESSDSEIDDATSKRSSMSDSELSSSEESAKESEEDVSNQRNAIPNDRRSENTLSFEDNSDRLDDDYSKTPDDLSTKNDDLNSGKPKLPASDFAAELARKLGGNFANQEVVIDKPERKIEPKPYNPGLHEKPPGRVTGNIFIDEPPPLEKSDIQDSGDNYVSTGLFGDKSDSDDLFSSDDIFGNKTKSEGLFDSGKTATKPAPIINSDIFGDEPDELFSSNKPKINNSDVFDVNKSKSDPFGNKIDSGRLFESNKSKITPKPTEPNKSKITPKPTESNKSKITLKPTEPNKSKPTNDIFDDDDESGGLFGSDKLKPSITIKTQTQNAKINTSHRDEVSIFDDDDSDDNLFGTTTKLPPKKDEPIFADLKPETKSVGVKKVPSLFDDLSDSDDGLFSSKSKIATQPVAKKVDITKKEAVKEPTSELSPKVDKVDDKPNVSVVPKLDRNQVIKPTSEAVSKLESVEPTPSEPPKVKKTEIKTIVQEPVKKMDAIPEPVEESISNTVDYSNRLFDDVPPPLDDAEPDEAYDDDLFSNFNQSRSKANDQFDNYDSVNLFSDEPPDYSSQADNSDVNNYSDIYADYPYYKTVNMVENKTDTPAKSGLFEESDDDDTLFKTDRPKSVKSDVSTEVNASTAPLSSSGINKPTNREDNMNESLFDDDEPVVEPEVEKFKSDVINPMIDTIKTESDKSEELERNETEKIANLESETDDSLFKPEVKPEPKTEVDGGLFSKSSDPEVKPPVKVGKLNRNLTINVQALLPGPKTVKEINKTVKPAESPTLPAAEPIPVVNDVPKPVSTPDDDSSFSEATSSTTLSNSILRDRVKIQVKRRPQTRKARHDAARKSAADIYVVEPTEPEFNSLPSSPAKEKTEEPKPAKIEPSKPNKKSGNLFADSDSDNDLFTFKPKNKPKITKASLDVFDDDDDLFAPNKSKPESKALFEDSDDDLFTAKKVPKPVQVKKDRPKPKSDVQFKDPLSSFLDD